MGVCRKGLAASRSLLIIRDAMGANVVASERMAPLFRDEIRDVEPRGKLLPRFTAQ